MSVLHHCSSIEAIAAEIPAGADEYREHEGRGQVQQQEPFSVRELDSGNSTVLTNPATIVADVTIAMTLKKR